MCAACRPTPAAPADRRIRFPAAEPHITLAVEFTTRLPHAGACVNPLPYGKYAPRSYLTEGD